MCKIKYIALLSFVSLFFSCDNLDISSSQADSFVKIYGNSGSDKGVNVKAYENGYKIIATTNIGGNDHTDISIITTDIYGNQKGEAIIIDGGGNDEAGNLLLTDDGGYIVVGTYTDTTSFYITEKTFEDIYVAKYSSNDELEWMTYIGKDSGTNEKGAAIKKAKTGYVIAGCTDRASAENPQGTKDVYLVKIDDSGNAI